MSAWEIQGEDALTSTSNLDVGPSFLDGSGWNVNFGSGRIESSRKETSTTPAVAQLDAYLPYVALAAGLLIAWRLTRRQK